MSELTEVSFPYSPPGLTGAREGSPYPLLPGGQGGPAGKRGWAMSVSVRAGEDYRKAAWSPKQPKLVASTWT